MKKGQLIAIGALIGAVVGYPLSYFFQMGALRFILSLGGYVENISSVLCDKDLASTAIGVWITSVVLLVLLALILHVVITCSEKGIHEAKREIKHSALFCLRWGIAIAGVWYVVAHMSLRDRAWVILDHETNRPVQVSLGKTVGEDAAQFPVIDPVTGKTIEVPREFVVNEPDQKTVRSEERKVG